MQVVEYYLAIKEGKVGNCDIMDVVSGESMACKIKSEKDICHMILILCQF